MSPAPELPRHQSLSLQHTARRLQVVCSRTILSLPLACSRTIFACLLGMQRGPCPAL